MSLSSNVSIAYRSTFQETIELEAITSVISRTNGISFSDGTGENQCDLVWSDQGSLSSPLSATLDLTSLASTLGTVTFA